MNKYVFTAVFVTSVMCLVLLGNQTNPCPDPGDNTDPCKEWSTTECKYVDKVLDDSNAEYTNQDTPSIEVSVIPFDNTQLNPGETVVTFTVDNINDGTGSWSDGQCTQNVTYTASVVGEDEKTETLNLPPIPVNDATYTASATFQFTYEHPVNGTTTTSKTVSATYTQKPKDPNKSREGSGTGDGGGDGGGGWIPDKDENGDFSDPRDPKEPEEPGVVTDLDADGDGIPTETELLFPCMNPERADYNSDYDLDGIKNGDEIMVHGLNPCDPDTDNDGLLDGWEIEYGFDPKDATDPLTDNVADDNPDADPDSDMLINLFEHAFGGDPSLANGDSDPVVDESTLSPLTVGSPPVTVPVPGRGQEVFDSEAGVPYLDPKTYSYKLPLYFIPYRAPSGAYDYDGNGVIDASDIQPPVESVVLGSDGLPVPDSSINPGFYYFDPATSAPYVSTLYPEEYYHIEQQEMLPYEYPEDHPRADDTTDAPREMVERVVLRIGGELVLGIDGNPVVFDRLKFVPGIGTVAPDPALIEILLNDGGIDDRWEALAGMDPLYSRDAVEPALGRLGLNNIGLFTFQNQMESDQDGDLIPDLLEKNADSGDSTPGFLTNPDAADTDLDGMPDGYEIFAGLDPMVSDLPDRDDDGDGVSNVDEFNQGLLPYYGDSDLDTLPDKWEMDHANDPEGIVSGTVSAADLIQGMTLWWNFERVRYGIVSDDSVFNGNAPVDARVQGYNARFSSSSPALKTQAMHLSFNSYRYPYKAGYLLAPDCDTLDLGQSDFTLAFWFRWTPDYLTPITGIENMFADERLVFSKGESYEITARVLQGDDDVESVKKVELTFAFVGIADHVSVVLPESEWSHVGVTFDAASSQLSIYSGAALVEQVIVASGQIVNSEKALMIGTLAQVPSRSLNFSLDDWRIYNRILAPDEFTQLAVPDSLLRDENKDRDGDGLTEFEEFRYGFSPFVPQSDTDGDGIPDILEIRGYAINSDGEPELFSKDGLGAYFTDPRTWDHDGDGLSDLEEARGILSVVNVTHLNGVTTSLERTIITSPTSRDSDRDRLDDRLERELYFTDPSNPDTDGDGRSNLQEELDGTNPNDPTDESIRISGSKSITKTKSVSPDAPESQQIVTFHQQTYRISYPEGNMNPAFIAGSESLGAFGVLEKMTLLGTAPDGSEVETSLGAANIGNSFTSDELGKSLPSEALGDAVNIRGFLNSLRRDESGYVEFEVIFTSSPNYKDDEEEDEEEETRPDTNVSVGGSNSEYGSGWGSFGYVSSGGSSWRLRPYRQIESPEPQPEPEPKEEPKETFKAKANSKVIVFTEAAAIQLSLTSPDGQVSTGDDLNDPLNCVLMPKEREEGMEVPLEEMAKLEITVHTSTPGEGTFNLSVPGSVKVFDTAGEEIPSSDFTVDFANPQGALSSLAQGGAVTVYFVETDIVSLNANFTASLGGSGAVAFPREAHFALVSGLVREVWSDQIPGVEANGFPDRTGPAEYPYIFMGATSGTTFNVKIKLAAEIPAALRSQLLFRWGTEGPFLNFIPEKGRSTFSDDTTVQLTSNFNIGLGRERYLIMAFDSNKSGEIDGFESVTLIKMAHIQSEQTTVIPCKFIPIAYADYEENRASLLWWASTSLSQNILTNGARHLTAFCNGTVPTFAGSEPTTIARNEDGLSHPVGVAFTPTNNPGLSFKAIISKDHELSQKLIESNALRAWMHKEFNAVADTIRAHIIDARENGNPSQVLSYPLPATEKSFGFGLSDPDLFVCLGKVTLQDPQIDFKVDMYGFVHDVKIFGKAIDLYDFDYEGEELLGLPARKASEVQAGFPSLGIGGKVFETQIDLGGGNPYANPDLTPYTFFSY